MTYPSRVLTPEQHARKTAFRLKRLGPMKYRRAVRRGTLPQV